MARSAFIDEKFKKASDKLDEAWEKLQTANCALAHVLKETGELSLPQPASYIHFEGGKIIRRWAVKARCLYGLRIEVLLEDNECDDLWCDLSNNETFWNDNLFNLLGSMEQAI